MACLLPADFNGDNRDDLVMGCPGENVQVSTVQVSYAGAVNVIYGAPAGLTATGDSLWHQDVVGIAGVAVAGDSLGAALATGDFNGDGIDDVAVGAFGNANGLGAATQFLYRDTPGIADAAEASDTFGDGFTSGDYNGDGLTDLGIASSFEDEGATDQSGSLHVLFGSPFAISTAGSQRWTQASRGVPESRVA